jgi:RNA polymerase sigma factor (sigma-70 family)
VEPDLNSLALAAQRGSRDALESLVGHIQGYIYNLALRMLAVPADAEDATQDILIRIVTHLSQFRGDSAFTTWMYSVATRMLLNASTRDTRRAESSFELLAARLEASLALGEPDPAAAVEDALLAEQVRRSCTLGMLTCLSPQERMALILAELIGLPGEDAARRSGISPAAYRQSVSRARRALISFMQSTCGIVNPDNPCRCSRHVAVKVATGRLNPADLPLNTADDAASAQACRDAADERLDAAQRSMALVRAHPQYAARADFVAMLGPILNPDDPDHQ